ncbi:MAG: SOS response-associated peptidase [Bacteroidia bacterium]|nr:SOS response-associated peptidase [Bacteroidia bacterium]
MLSAMLTAYTFNSSYRPTQPQDSRMPSLRLLEGGKFSPGQYAPVLIQEYGQIRLHFFRWGLVPAWTKSGRQDSAQPYAPAAHLWNHPAFQLPLRRQRCLVPADGYYVEQTRRHEPQLWKFSREEAETFCFAGIYDTWRLGDGSLLHTFAVVTTDARPDLAHYSLQMPLILPRKLESAWLDPHTDSATLQAALHAPERSRLRPYAVQELALQQPAWFDHAAA